ncbi:cobalt-precorrin-5B (C(1))-methyltransferase [Vibrio panuliri]|uniref:Cobalt-precorrin-5B C(1)-methyltransferase n=1 Tax=Vibrio panuliri TaxID=1381081 RepID=A0A1Q9HJG0_9VIBR|nr:cobalt-precorrin-5B (C(1))-methyltransferase [Vibrio panuliri]OLQ90443.1 cobalt-precorrin-5B (C(1))-methyltransferase [Vibrio panuliri]
MAKLKRSRSNQDLRGGYTTGACAAAAARAALRFLLTEQAFKEIEIQLPNRELASFQLARLGTVDQSGNRAAVIAGVVKDAGDDPDCTHGIEIQCIAQWVTTPGIHLKGGKGVATVTLPGLELPVGEPAINPVPRANIHEMAMLELEQHGRRGEHNLGLELEIVVPQGELVAKETIGERLGLVGGISILGTRGTVKPYSTSAFASSVRQSVQIAAANGLNHLVLTTGSRSEKAAMALLPELTNLAFVQAGDFSGIGLRAAKRYGVSRVSLVVMIGKLGKLISGRMMTHVSGHAIDFTLMSALAQQAGLSPSLCQQIASANTGRHVLDLVRQQLVGGDEGGAFLEGLCQEAWQHANHYTSHQLTIDITLIDFDGVKLAGYPNDAAKRRDALAQSHR